MESIKLQAIGTILQMVRFETELPEEELYRVAREREPQFRALTGLLQKYYLKLGPREYGGVYIWDSAESLQAYRDSDLAHTIPQAYKVVGTPKVEVSQILFPLRS